MLKHSSGFYIGSMRQHKLFLVPSCNEAEEGNTKFESHLSEVSAEAIRSLHFKHKAVTSAWFSFSPLDSAALQKQQAPGILSLLELELKQRGLLFKRVVAGEANGQQLSSVSVLVFSIDQQAARRLAQRFQPEKALWFNRMGASKLLLAQSNDVDSVCE
jgi:hypothetical protein